MLGRRRLTNLDTIQGSFITPTMGNRGYGDKRSGKEKKTEVVFLVEDEQDTADLVRLQLVKAGMSVLHVKDGRQATDIIDKIMPPRAVLLDLAVPYVNGFELLKKIRTKAGWEKVPVMIVSGNSNAGEIQRMMRAGAKDYVVKSVGVGALAHRLKGMLEKGA